MSRHYSLIQEQLFDTTPIPSTPEAIAVATPQATVDCDASSPNSSQSGLPAPIAPRSGFNMQHPLDSLPALQDHLLSRLSPCREDLNTFDQRAWHPRAGEDMQADWETNSDSTATGNIIVKDLQRQALFQSAG